MTTSSHTTLAELRIPTTATDLAVAPPSPSTGRSTSPLLDHAAMKGVSLPLSADYPVDDLFEVIVSW